jgi:hypothetical protein
MFLGSRARPVRGADNRTAICELSRKCVILNISQFYTPTRPVTGTASLFAAYNFSVKETARMQVARNKQQT